MPEHRRGAPGTRYARMDAVTGVLVRLAADGLGVVAVRTEAERRAADAIGLPVTRVPKLSSAEVADLRKKSKE